MSEQYSLDLQPKAEGPDYEALSDAELRVLYKEKMGVPIPADKARIIEALRNPTEHLQERLRTGEEDRKSLR